jgi:peptidoglycan/xylan/chitin deacetylase (PgdA/CDA1 family)
VATSIPILTFHAVDDAEPPLSFPPNVFRAGMLWLRDQGFRAITVREARRVLQSEEPPTGRTVALSFDDGYRSVFDEALPVLRDVGFTATLFVNDAGQTDEPPPMEGRERMTWKQIEKLRDAGFEIGAHTLTHPDLTRVGRSRMEAEIAGSRVGIESRLGVKVTSFAYPFGRWNAAARGIARMHFECACTTRLAIATTDSDPFTLPRVESHYFRQMQTFRLLAGALLPPYLVVRSIPRSIRELFIRASSK